MKITKDTVLFEKGDIKLTADDIKLYIDDYDICTLSIYVDISKFYKVTQIVGSKHRIKKLIHFGDIRIKPDINSITSCKAFKFIDNDCELIANSINKIALYDEKLSFLFINNCKRNDYYKKHITFANLDHIKHYIINYSTLNYKTRKTVQYINIHTKTMFNEISKLIDEVFSYRIFNNDMFCYKITDGHFYYSSSPDNPYMVIFNKKKRYGKK